MRKPLTILILFIALPCFAGDHPAAGTLNITHYSHSILKNGTICEGSQADRTLANGKQFDDVAVPEGQAPKTVALNAKHHAKGCTLEFKTGPWAGQSVPVGDVNGHDTIDIAIDTRQAKDKAACQQILQKATPSVQYALTNCPGDRGTSPAVKRAKGTEGKL